VKAVRNIDFELNKGETLAIVGESGSGKSVTARAIMGILAGNSITESGEIFYDGMDLTKISEEEFQQIRGNRISMIFQDPFSSLNPIVRIGKQLTEAMLLNSKINRRDAKRRFYRKINLLSKYIKDAGITGTSTDTLRKFSLEGSNMERPYNAARGNIIAAVSSIDGVLIDLIRGEPKRVVRDINRILQLVQKCRHKYLTRDESGLDAVIMSLKDSCAAYLKNNAEAAKAAVRKSLDDVRKFMADALDLPIPDFFAMGYHKLHSKKALDDNDIGKMNVFLKKYLHESFMDAFLEESSSGIKLSHTQSIEKKKRAVESIAAKRPLFENVNPNISDLKSAAKDLIKVVGESIDRLAVRKDSIAYTFKSGLNSELAKYIRAIKVKGKKRLSRKDREFADYADVDLYRENILTFLSRLHDSYVADLERSHTVDYALLADETAELIKADSSRMVYKVTKRMAKSRAIGLMEEVGIPEG
jgi:ABC-type dipeptide/oligopeptide/nickel transport system ATPase component